MEFKGLSRWILLAAVTQYSVAISVPHSEKLPFPLTDGTAVIVEGVPIGDRFSVNLSEGPHLNTTVLLQIDPRFDQNQVVRNSNQEGHWGPEERDGPFPFYMNTPYVITIEVKEESYHIHVNYTFLYEYKHRIPKELAKFLVVEGNTTLTNISYRTSTSKVINNPDVPFDLPITGGHLSLGRRIEVDGVPYSEDGFSINFVCGPTYEDNDIAFHFNPRFDDNVVVRNDRQGDMWGQEERQQKFFPFKLDSRFKVMFVVTNAFFRVMVDDVYYTDFKFRLLMGCATTFSVRGGVVISQVKFF